MKEERRQLCSTSSKTQYMNTCVKPNQDSMIWSMAHYVPEKFSWRSWQNSEKDFWIRCSVRLLRYNFSCLKLYEWLRDSICSVDPLQLRTLSQTYCYARYILISGFLHPYSSPWPSPSALHRLPLNTKSAASFKGMSKTFSSSDSFWKAWCLSSISQNSLIIRIPETLFHIPSSTIWRGKMCEDRSFLTSLWCCGCWGKIYEDEGRGHEPQRKYREVKPTFRYCREFHSRYSNILDMGVGTRRFRSLKHCTRLLKKQNFSRRHTISPRVEKQPPSVPVIASQQENQAQPFTVQPPHIQLLQQTNYTPGSAQSSPDLIFRRSAHAQRERHSGNIRSLPLTAPHGWLWHLPAPSLSRRPCVLSSASFPSSTGRIL